MLHARWRENYENKLFYHVSTDEVYGALGNTGKFVETTPYDPHSPYSASKASSDHFGKSISRYLWIANSNKQLFKQLRCKSIPEKLIPLAINNIKQNRSVPIYGKGESARLAICRRSRGGY